MTAGATAIDITSTTAGNVLDSETLQHLPVGRSLASTLYLVPGVTMSAGISLAGGNAIRPSMAPAASRTSI